MITFPNSKINLGLNILRKRNDDFHDLETVFFPVEVNDALEIVTSTDKTEFTNTGIQVGDNKNNLCLKAYQILKNDFPQLPKIKIHLHKLIPLGAGLGGGSGDAAFTLMMLNEKYELRLSTEKLCMYASQLGSDCPFFIVNKPCFATGRGENLEAINLSLSGYKILLINPGIHINTKDVFAKINPSIPAKNIREIIKQPIETWKDELVNDFEKVIFSNHPEIQAIKETMYENKALYASMTGTGSTVYGIFKSEEEMFFHQENGYFYKWIAAEGT